MKDEKASTEKEKSASDLLNFDEWACDEKHTLTPTQGDGSGKSTKINSGGTKHDSEKIPLQLLSGRWLLGVGRVLAFGAKKYAAHNWRQGLEQSRLLGATLRHVLAFLDGEDLDPETGLSHLYHASCCLMFASEMWETRPDKDDRWKPPVKNKWMGGEHFSSLWPDGLRCYHPEAYQCLQYRMGWAGPNTHEYCSCECHVKEMK